MSATSPPDRAITDAPPSPGSTGDSASYRLGYDVLARYPPQPIGTLTEGSGRLGVGNGGRETDGRGSGPPDFEAEGDGDGFGWSVGEGAGEGEGGAGVPEGVPPESEPPSLGPLEPPPREPEGDGLGVGPE